MTICRKQHENPLLKAFFGALWRGLILCAKLDNHESRISNLEKLCQQMNTNISSLQTIVTALQNNDYITGVTPITENGATIGYTITFAKAKPITIYNGKDGITPQLKIENDYW